MNWWKNYVSAFAAAFLFFSLALPLHAQESPHPRVAGIISTKSTYWQEMLQGMKDGCEELGLSFFVLDISLQDRDALTWSSQEAWELALLSDVDVIIADGNLPDPELARKARSQGIFLVLVDSDAGEELRDAYVGTDNAQAGALAVQALEELYGIGSGPVMVQNSPNISALAQRFSGIRNALEQYSPAVEIKFPRTPWYWERMFNSSLEELIGENPDLQAIFGLLEAETNLYAQVLRQLNLEHKIPLITFDLSPGILELLEDGVVDAVIVQQSYEIGYQSAKIAGLLSTGEALADDTVYIDCSIINRDDLPLLGGSTPDRKESNDE